MSSESRKYVSGGVLFALCAFMAVGAASVVWADGGGGNIDEQPEVAPREMFIESIAGLTTARHRAPDRLTVPRGTEIGFFLSVPESAEVTLSGANMTARMPEGLYMTCTPMETGLAMVEAMTETADGKVFHNACRLDVVATAVETIAAQAVTASVAPFEVDANTSNAERVRTFFGESIASFDPLISTVDTAALDGRRRPGNAAQSTAPAYRTSVDRTIDLTAIVNQPDFAPLMEWRIDGHAWALGEASQFVFNKVGRHIVEVGPPERSAKVMIQTYRTIITSHAAGENSITEDEWITFEAETDPPGFENDITWLSATKFGTAEPAVGQGPVFAARFADTFGPTPDGGLWQWAGVKADNARVGQDQKQYAVSLESTPLTGDLLIRVASSSLTQGFEQSLAALGYSMDFAAATEETFLFSLSSAVPPDARHAVVPVVDGSGDLVGQFAHSSTLTIEGADFVRFFTPDIDPDQMTVRTYIDPDLCAWVDVIVNEDGSVTTDVVENCPVRAGQSYGTCLGLGVALVVGGAERLGIGSACRALCATCAVPPHASCLGCGTCAIGYIGCATGIWWGCL